MFPTLRVSFTGLEEDCHYDVYMDIIPVDSKRYRYAYHRSSWLVAGKGDPAQSTIPHRHHDSPILGSSLARQTVSFEKIKLTNNNVQKNDHIILNSMHKYRPRIHLIKRNNSVENNADNGGGSRGGAGGGGDIVEITRHHTRKSFVFNETTFIAVTAYQNQLITKLKIDSNPFAKGFRDSSRLSDMERETMEGMLGGLPKSSYLELHAQLAAAAKFVSAHASVNQTLQTTPMFPIPHSRHMIGYPSVIPNRSKFEDHHASLKTHHWNLCEETAAAAAAAASVRNLDPGKVIHHKNAVHIRFKPYR